MSRDADVLWLIEHTARELDVACAVSALAHRRYGVTIAIRNLYQHIGEYLPAYRPRVVVHPFVYFVEGALATEDVFARWPDAVHFNLAWEQIHYRAHLAIKAPADEAARHRTIHHAWGEFYRRYLLEHGVPDRNIFVNGQPSYRLYAEPYRRFFADRAALAKTFDLDPDKRWIFVPDNYRWAFAERKLPFFVAHGGDARELRSLVNFSVPSLERLLRACREAAADENLEVILRPRPSVSTREFLQFYWERVGEDTGRMRLLKEGSVREWIMASDVVISSYSTSLIEAAVAGKPAWMFEPIPIPEALHCEWYDYVPRVRGSQDVLRACHAAPSMDADYPLRAWAHANLLACGDPLQRLALQLALLVDRARGRSSAEGPLPRDLDSKDYFNRETHEKDAFAPADVEAATAEWSSLLASTPAVDPIVADWSRGEIVNKSMDRDDLVRPDAAALVADLDALIRRLSARGVTPSSWVGTIAEPAPSAPTSGTGRGGRQPAQARTDAQPGGAGSGFREGMAGTMVARLQRLVGRGRHASDTGEAAALTLGERQRLDYQPLSGAADDRRFPWFLYWEIYWVLHVLRPRLMPGVRILDAGGVSSLFTCYLASLGHEVHSVDRNERLVENARRVASAMDWSRMSSYTMDMTRLAFPDGHFDHAVSICIFQHFDHDLTQAALREIARCLKPGGLLALTFDYRSPAPGIVGVGKDPRPRNALGSEADIHRSFIRTGQFRVVGNPLFQDDGASYLLHPRFPRAPYTFGALFLERL